MPPSLWKLELLENAEKHVVIQNVFQVNSKEIFLQNIKNNVAAIGNNKSGLVFIHGFNVSFEEAARSTAQLSYDLEFEGTPFLFSWPSNGKLFDYPSDREDAEAAGIYLMRFLKEIIHESGIKSIHIVAHSMGNIALLNALRLLGEDHQLAEARNSVDIIPPFDNIVLAAPDIDVENFKTYFVKYLPMLSHHSTLYTSEHDTALIASHKWKQFPRLGGMKPNVLNILPQMDTIDCGLQISSGIFKKLNLDHSYYGKTSFMLDLKALFKNIPTHLRNLVQKKSTETNIPFWLLPFTESPEK